MRRAVAILGVFWRGTRYLWLIVLSSVLGAILAESVGFGVALLTGEPKWMSHVRCAAWTLFGLAATVLAIGAPSVIERFWHTTIRRTRGHGGGRREGAGADHGVAEDSNIRVVSGIRAVPAVCLIGGFAGLLCGAMVSGMAVVVYFFLALSPFARDGWWPVLPWYVHGTGDGFIAEGDGAPSGYIFLVIFGVTILAMIAVGFTGSWSSGQTRYAVFRARGGRGREGERRGP